MLLHTAQVGLLETYRYLGWMVRGRDAKEISSAPLVNVEDG